VPSANDRELGNTLNMGDGEETDSAPLLALEMKEKSVYTPTDGKSEKEGVGGGV
jgi:hypothetical protein